SSHNDSEELYSRNRSGRGCGHGKYSRGQVSVYTLPDLSNYNLTNIKIQFLLALTTSYLQPIDAEIIKCFKNKLNIKETIDYIAASWDKVEELTITNCWIKTGILLLVSNEDVELAQNTYLESIKCEESEIYELVVDLTEDTVAQEIDAYREVNQTHIPTEEILNDTQIVKTYEQGNSDDSDKELPKITAAEGITDQSMSINDNFFNKTEFFDDGNVFPDNDNFFGGNNFSDSNDFSEDNFSDDDDFFDDNNLFYYHRFIDNYDSSDNY
ncbi:6896_t:CDS:2, partial [Scutellospora calospora]